MNKEIKLHLGCGQNYLEGYINVDLPTEGQTVMEAKADVYKDIRELEYEQNSVDEIRAHHLLEHFSRQESLKLLLQWRGWLKPGGRLVIETPDFETGFEKFATVDIKTKFKIARHLFGAQETDWAYHRDWWGEEKWNFVLAKLGFELKEVDKITDYTSKYFPDRLSKYIVKILPSHVDFLDNIVIRAVKTDSYLDEKEATRGILSMSLIGKDDKMLDVWMDDIWKE